MIKLIAVFVLLFMAIGNIDWGTGIDTSVDITTTDN